MSFKKTIGIGRRVSFFYIPFQGIGKKDEEQTNRAKSRLRT